MAVAQDLSFTFVELNCENLFDTKHDSLKNDREFCEGGTRRWTPQRYWHKVNAIGKELVSCGGEGENWQIPDLVALIEVENDSVLFDLTRRSLLRKAGYQYVMTDSPDQRGIDVALLYQPFSFMLDTCYSIRITPPAGRRPTRDILYVKGYADVLAASDSALATKAMHVFVVHAPSRSGGQSQSEPYRLLVSSVLCGSIDSIRADEPDARIIVAGDFNDYYTDASVRQIEEHGMKNVSAGVQGHNGAKGTYRYQGEWGSLDQIIVSESLLADMSDTDCHIHDLPFLTEEDKVYGGVRPHRTYSGFKYDSKGFSDHLPLILKAHFEKKH